MMKDNRAIEMTRDEMLKAFQQNKDKINEKDYKKLQRELNGGSKLKKFTQWLKDQITEEVNTETIKLGRGITFERGFDEYGNKEDIIRVSKGVNVRKIKYFLENPASLGKIQGKYWTISAVSMYFANGGREQYQWGQRYKTRLGWSHKMYTIEDVINKISTNGIINQDLVLISHYCTRNLSLDEVKQKFK